MAAIPGEADGWPAAPEPQDAGPAGTLTPAAASDPDPVPQPAPWGQPPLAFGSATPPMSLLTAHAGYAGQPGTGYADQPGTAYADQPGTEYAAEPDGGHAPESVPDYPWGAAATGQPQQVWLDYGWADEDGGWADEDGDPPAGAVAVRAAGRAQPLAVPVADPFTGPVDQTERAVIGDKLRAPGVWCELSPCISHHLDPAALGVADMRRRAIDAGWRLDAFGLLACPDCQQTDTRFRGTHAVVRWERDTAITMAALMVAGFQETLRGRSGFSEETAVIPVFPAAVIPPGSKQAPGPPARDAWQPR